MTGPIARIILRYVAMALVARGIFTAEDASTLSSDGDLLNAIEIGVGALIGVGTEAWYYLARKFGWNR